MEDYEYLERQLEGKHEGSPDAAEKANGDHANGDEVEEKARSKSRERRSRERSKSKRSSRSRSREKARRRSRSRSRDRRRSKSRDRDTRRRSRSRDRYADRGRERYDTRYDQRGRGGGGGSYRRRDRTPPEDRLAREKERELKELDRATRTVFASNINLKADERDIFKFFSQAGTVQDIQLITDKNTRRSKGMAYIELKSQEEVFRAITTLNGQIFMNMPVMLKTSEVEKNLAWEAQQAQKQQQSNADAASSLLSSMGGGGGPGVPAGLGSCRLQVSNLHRDIEDIDLKDAFEPFGFLEMIQVARDANGTSLGYGFVQFREYADGVKAMQTWNGKPLGGMVLEVQMAPLPPAIPAAPVIPPLLPPEMVGFMAGGGMAGFPGITGIPGLTAMPGVLPGVGLPPPPAYGDPAAAAAAAAAAAGNPYAAMMPQAGFPQPPAQAAAPAVPAAPTGTINDLDDIDDESSGKGGLRLDAQKRAALMQRLAAAAGLETKPATYPGMPGAPGTAPAPAPAVSQMVMLDQGLLGPASPIPTPAILLKNMFDPAEEEARGEPNWVVEVEGDVREECSRFGEVQHLFVDKNSKGFVYVKFAAQAGAEAAHRTLNLRWYSGKQIIVEYQFVQVYNSVFGLR